MKKQILKIFLSLSLFCAFSLRAEDAPPQETPPPPPREVGKGSADGVDTGKQKNIGNIAIALLAITVATAAIILVSKNEGKRA